MPACCVRCTKPASSSVSWRRAGSACWAPLLRGGAWRAGGGRRRRGPFWWRALPAPLVADATIDHCWRVVWDLVRGAAQLKAPPAGELGRRYAELLAENLGQPGFRELLIVAHDVDG